MKKILFAFLLSALAAVPCYAEGFENVSVVSDMYIGKVLISGEYDSEVTNRWVSAVVTDKNETEINVSDFSDKVIGTAQAEINEEGKFSAEIVLPESVPTGSYKIFLVPEYGEEYTQFFEHNGRGEINSVLRSLNALNDGSKIIDKISESKDILKTDVSFFDEIDKDSYSEILLKSRPDKGWNNINSLKKSMQLSKSLYDINKAVNAEEIDAALKNYGEDFNYEEYSGIYQSIKSAIVSKLIKKNDFKTAAEFKEFYENEYVICSITDAPNWSYTKKALENDYIKSLLSENALNKLKALKYTEEVYKAVYTKRSAITDILSVINTYETAINSQYTDETKISQGGGNTGGGGGGTVAPSVTPKPQENVTVKFNDIDGVAWAKDAIEYLAEKNIINGTGDKTFSPNENVTREQFVKMIINALNFEKTENDVDFKDVSKNMWYYEYICSAYDNGIINGIDGNNFGIGGFIMRQDLAAIVYRAAQRRGLNGTGAQLSCSDKDNIRDYAAEAVAELQRLGIISGMGDNRFEPEMYATRAQAAKIIYGIIIALTV